MLTNRRFVLSLLAVLFALAPAHAKRDKLLDLSFRGPELFSYERLQNGTQRVTSQVPRLLGVSSANVLGEWYAGYSSAGDLLDLSGNGRDLADTNGPAITNAILMGDGGNQLQSFAYGGGSRHELAHAAWMNVFDTSFTVSMIVKAPTTNPGSHLYFFSHGTVSTAGINAFFATSGYFGFYLSNSALSPTSKSALGPTTNTDGLYHIIHLVKNGNFISTYVDGIPGPITDATGSGGEEYGKDANYIFYVGTNNWTEHIAYTRLQNTVLTYAQIQKENDLFKGILGSRAPFQYASPTFLRSTTSYGDRATGSTPLYQVPANWPVKTSDGGMLVESSVANALTYTGAFSTGWAKTASSVAATAVILPDGTTGTTNVLHEDGVGAGNHEFHHSISVTLDAKYCGSLYAKYNPSPGGADPTPREWIALRLNDPVKSAITYYNIRYGYKGGSTGSPDTYDIKPVGNGWYRVWLCYTAGNTSAAGAYWIYGAEANMDIGYLGKDQDSYFIAYPQFEPNAFPTVYAPNPTTGASRAADNLTYIPWRISKDLRAKVNATPRLLFLGSESLAGATVTPTVGAYSFAKYGRPQNDETYAEGASFKMNGTTDYLSLADTGAGDPFRPVGDFSVIATVTPNTISGVQAFVGKSGASGNYGWSIRQNTANVEFSRSTNGTAAVTLIVPNCLEVGKPVMVTASYSTATGSRLMVDAFAAATDPSLLTTNGSSAALNVGAVNAGNAFNGKIHYAAYYDGYVVSQAEHDAMYNDWKSDGILPLNISSTAAKTKLVVECEVKGQYSSAADNGGQYRTFLAIGGIYGTSSVTPSNRNNLYLQSVPDGSSYAVLHTDVSTTDRYIYSAVRTDHNKWTRHKWVVDTVELANSTYHINGVLQTGYTQMSGAASFGLRDTLIRVGASANGTILGNMEIRNVKIGAE